MKAAGRISPLWIVAALTIADVTASFETSMMFTSLPSVLLEYGRPTTTAWLVTGYMLMAAASAAICGRLGDLFGRRRLLLIVLTLAAAGSLIGVVAPTLEGVIFGRCLQGLAGSILPLCFGLAREHVPTSQLPLSLTVIAAGSPLGSGLGTIVAGIVVDNWGWRHVFGAGFAMAVISFVTVALLVPPSKGVQDGRRLDLVGGILFAPAVAIGLMAISNGRDWGWDGRVWGLLAASLLLLALWVRHELRCPHPLLDVRLLANRRIALSNLLLAIVGWSGLTVTQLLLLLLQQPAWTGVGLGLTATAAAAIKVPGNFATAAAGAPVGALCRRWGPSTIMIIGGLISSVSFFSLIFFHNQVWAIFIVSITGTIGVTSVLMAVPIVLVSAAPDGRTSEVAGVSSVTRSVALAIGVQTMLIILASDTVSSSEHPGVFGSLAAYQTQFALMGVGGIVLSVVAWLAREGPLRGDPPDGAASPPPDRYAAAAGA